MTADTEEIGARVTACLLDRGGRMVGGELRCTCWNHSPDEHPSLRWNTKKHVFHCDACGIGGGAIEAARALGLLDDVGALRSTERKWEIRTASGELVAVHHRTDHPEGSKDRVWWTAANGAKKLGRSAASLPLYAGDRLVESDAWVILTEGEPACDALLSLGLPAVATVTGAGGCPDPAVLERLRGRRVLLWADADDQGRMHMRRLAGALAGIASETAIFDTPRDLGEGADAVEFLAERGEIEPEALIAELLSAATCETSEPEGLCWSLRELLERPVELPPAVVPRLAWPGRATLLSGREKSGKSTLLTAAAAAVSTGGTFLGVAVTKGTVLWASEEHPADVARRLRDFGADPDAVHVMQWRGDAIAEIRAQAERLHPTLLVVDTLAAVAEAAAPESGSASQWAKVMRPLVRIARETGCALVILHHATKADDKYRDSGEIGAAVDVIAEMSIAGGGALRPIAFAGRYGRGKFTLRMVGRVFELVDERDEDDLHDKVAAFVQAHPGSSQQAVVDGIPQRAVEVRRALAELVQRAQIDDLGTARSHLYHPAGTSSRDPDDPRPEGETSSGPSGLWDEGFEAC